jgi:hypothetical protein
MLGRADSTKKGEWAMPRKPMSAPHVSEMVKQLSLASIMQVIPLRKVEEALKVTKTASVRNRLLPAPMVVYLVLMLALYSEVSVRENMAILLEHLRGVFGQDRMKRPADSAVSKARQRLAAKPFRWLFEQVARPRGDANLPGCCWRNFRVVAADGTTADVQDTPPNRKRFGLHHNQHGRVGYPQMKAVVLTECGTRLPLACALGRNDMHESVLFDQIASALEKDMLMLADRAYYSFLRWKICAEQAGALLWRVKSSLILKPIENLPDGSYLTRIRPSDKLTRKRACRKDESFIVRAIEYRPLFEDGSEGDLVRLITTFLDPAEAPAEELAKLYADRWSAETSFDEIKTHLRGPRVLRSPLPELVEQEWFGFLLAYYVVRAAIVEAARREGAAPRAFSFVRAVRVIKRRLSFPPSDKERDEENI